MYNGSFQESGVPVPVGVGVSDIKPGVIRLIINARQHRYIGSFQVWCWC